jgi:hypothetical protein
MFEAIDGFCYKVGYLSGTFNPTLLKNDFLPLVLFLPNIPILISESWNCFQMSVLDEQGFETERATNDF